MSRPLWRRIRIQVQPCEILNVLVCTLKLSHEWLLWHESSKWCVKNMQQTFFLLYMNGMHESKKLWEHHATEFHKNRKFALFSSEVKLCCNFCYCRLFVKFILQPHLNTSSTANGVTDLILWCYFQLLMCLILNEVEEMGKRTKRWDESLSRLIVFG